MSVSKWLVCMFALAGWSGCYSAAPSGPVGPAASKPAGAPRALLFAFGEPSPLDDPGAIVPDHPVRVMNVVPDALDRHQSGHCPPADDWRSELVAPIVTFVTTDILKPTERLRYVTMFDKGAELYVFRDLRIALQPGELGMVIDPSVVILYDRARELDFCLTVVEKDEILIKLDLSNIIEGNEHL